MRISVAESTAFPENVAVSSSFRISVRAAGTRRLREHIKQTLALVALSLAALIRRCFSVRKVATGLINKRSGLEEEDSK